MEMIIGYAFVIGFVVGAAFMAVLLNVSTTETPIEPEPKRAVVTAAEIVAKKRPKPLRLRKSTQEERAEFEAKHSTKQQRHERLVQEIEHVASREVDTRVGT